MRNNTLLAATAAAALLAGTAVGHADTLASGLLSGGFIQGGLQQNRATCTQFNAGPTAVDVTSMRIVSESGQPISLSRNTCGTSLNAGQGCLFSGGINSTLAYACIVTTQGADSGMRGSLELGSSTLPANVALPLQATASAPGAN